MDQTLYEWLLFGHILFAAVWVGGDTMIQAFALRALRAGPERSVALLGDVEWIGMRLLTPASALLVILGFGLVAEGNWQLGEFWLLAGIAVFAASFLTGVFFLGPESGRIGKLIADRGADDADVQRRIRRILAFSRIELVLLIAVVYVMIAKPGL